MNKSTMEIKTIIDEVVDFPTLILKLMRLANKATPDVAAAKLLLEYRFGKPHQSMQVKTDNETTIRFTRENGNNSPAKDSPSGPSGDTQ